MPRLATVLDAVSDASLEIGIVQRPVTNIVGTADQDIAQMTALLQNVADELLIDPPYRDLLGDGNWLIDSGGTVRKSRPTVGQRHHPVRPAPRGGRPQVPLPESQGPRIRRGAARLHLAPQQDRGPQRARASTSTTTWGACNEDGPARHICR